MSEQINQPKKRLVRVDILLSCLFAVMLIAFYQKVEEYGQKQQENIESQKQKAKSNYKFGFDVDHYHINSFTFKKGDVLGNILQANGINSQQIHTLAEKSKDIFDVRKMRVGNNLHIIKNDSCSNALAFVYEPNKLNYVVYDLREDINIRLFEKEINTCTDIAAGVIQGSLWATMDRNNIPYSIIDKMEEALASSVDFYHTQEGDEFKLVFEKTYVENEEVGTGKLLGAYFKNAQGAYYSVLYQNGKYDGYYDYEGRPSKSSFLKAPIKQARISSSFSMARFHPIKKKTIPHLGTDYAAPYGTPIIAVADGVVEEAAYRGGNGRFVKLKHDKVYQTQYLHMQAFAPGIRVGKRVKQGETIGFVGSTGLATGPHVCFRFWKNGSQVNHLRHVFDPPAPMAEDDLPDFYKHRDIIKFDLDALDVNPTYVDKV